MYVRKKRESTM